MKKILFFIFLVATFMATNVRAQDNFTQKTSTEICPNPNNGQFDVLVDYPENTFSILIYNVMSKKVYEKNFTADDKKITIDLQTSPRGLYCLVLKNKNDHIIKRFIKN